MSSTNRYLAIMSSMMMALLLVLFRLRIGYAIVGSATFKVRSFDVLLFVFCVVPIMLSVYFVVNRLSPMFVVGSRYSIKSLLALIGFSALFATAMGTHSYLSLDPWTLDRALEIAVYCGMLFVPFAIVLLIYDGVRYRLR